MALSLANPWRVIARIEFPRDLSIDQTAKSTLFDHEGYDGEDDEQNYNERQYGNVHPKQPGQSAASSHKSNEGNDEYKNCNHDDEPVKVTWAIPGCSLCKPNSNTQQGYGEQQNEVIDQH